MLRVGFANIHPEKEQRLRDWLSELGQREQEVLETFRRETIRHEQVFIVQAAEGPLLVYAMEAQDHEVAKKAYATSPLSIDVQHRAVLKECLREGPSVLPLFECFLPEIER